MSNDNYIPISYLAQYYYCPRRAGLIMLDQAWSDNEDTASGTHEHNRVHSKSIEKRGAMLKIHGLFVSSEGYMLSGKCDCVEAYEDTSGVVLPFSDMRYVLYPVEFKHGVVRNEKEYNIQLCAQAMCLEEMFSCSIKMGAIFYVTSHRRQEVMFTDDLRKKVIEGARRLKEMLESGNLPKAKYSAKCKKCSLVDLCNPKIRSSASNYCLELIKFATREEGD